MKSKISDELKRLFNPEFLNRIDDIVFFHQLEMSDTLKIVDIVLREMSDKVADQKIQFVLTEGAKKFIAENGFDPVNGARPLKRAIQKYIEDPIADEILKGTFGEGSIIQIKMKNKSEEAVALTFDGQVGYDIYYDDKVIIRKSGKKIKLFRPPDHSYFNILRTKLMWGGTTYNKDEDH